MRHNSWRATKSYRFNGQVVAQRKNGVLSYLHSDHLGSTVLTTNSSGVVSGNHGYFAYGPGAPRARYGSEVATENRFTGQKLDGAGLLYFNARYYDPELGQFISPDTLVPDPSNLFDYNRYLYSRGNPMKYNDPTGHCATLDDGSPDLQGDQECWGLAYSIYGYGLGGVNGFGKDWKVSPDEWLKNIASAGYATSEYLSPFKQQYANEWCAGAGQAGCGGSYVDNPVTSQDQAFEQFMKNSGLEKLKPAAAAVATLDCTTRDCVAIGIDTVGVVGSALKYGSVACGVGGPGAVATCAKIGGVVSNVATGAGAVWTGIQYARGNATNKDLEVAAATTFTGFAGDTATSLRAGVVQWVWDTTISPFWNTLWK